MALLPFWPYCLFGLIAFGPYCLLGLIAFWALLPFGPYCLLGLIAFWAFLFFVFLAFWAFSSNVDEIGLQINFDKLYQPLTTFLALLLTCHQYYPKSGRRPRTMQDLALL